MGFVYKLFGCLSLLSCYIASVTYMSKTNNQYKLLLDFFYMVEKLFITANDLLIDSYKLAKQVLDSDFRPNFIVGLWRGGTPVGIAVQEYLAYHKIETDHIAIRTSAYEGVDKMSKQIRVHGLDYIVETANAEDSLLFVDDVFDTGLSMQEVLRTYQNKARRNIPHDIRIATVYYKPSRKHKSVKITPDFYIHETKKWLVFPHELEDLTLEEIRMFKGKEIAGLFGQ